MLEPAESRVEAGQDRKPCSQVLGARQASERGGGGPADTVGQPRPALRCTLPITSVVRQLLPICSQRGRNQCTSLAAQIVALHSAICTFK